MSHKTRLQVPTHNAPRPTPARQAAPRPKTQHEYGPNIDPTPAEHTAATISPPPAGLHNFGRISVFTPAAAARSRPALVTRSDIIAAPPIVAAPIADSPIAAPTATPAAVAARPGHQLSRFSIHPPLPTGVQAKLTVGESNDTYEQEADRVAETVMNMPASATANSPNGDDDDKPATDVQAKSMGLTITPWVQRQTDIEEKEEDEPVQAQTLIQRQSEAEEDGEEPVQTKSLIQRQEKIEEKEEDASVQTKSSGAKALRVNSENENYINGMRDQGQPLSRSERDFFEPRFGHDFGRVRIHADGQAENAARQINAQAFTVGHNVFFGANRYQPGTKSGRQLLAHELTHTVQQNNTQSNFWKTNNRHQMYRMVAPQISHHNHSIISRNGDDATSQAQNNQPVNIPVANSTTTANTAQGPDIADATVDRSQELDTAQTRTTGTTLDRASIIQSEPVPLPDAVLSTPTSETAVTTNTSNASSGQAVSSEGIPSTDQATESTTTPREPLTQHAPNPDSPQLAALADDIRGFASAEKASFQQAATQRRTALQQSIIETVTQIEARGVTQSQALSAQIETRRIEVQAQYSDIRTQVQQVTDEEKQQAVTDAEQVLLSIPQMESEIRQEALVAAETEAELMESFGGSEAQRVRTQDTQTIQRLNAAKRNAANSVLSSDSDVINAVNSALEGVASESINDVRDKGERTATAATNTANEVASSIRTAGQDVADSVQDTTQLEQGINETAQAVVEQIEGMKQATLARLDESEQRIMTNLDQAQVEMVTAVQQVTQTAAGQVHANGQQVLSQLEQSESSILDSIDGVAEQAIASMSVSGSEGELPTDQLAEIRTQISGGLSQARIEAQTEYLAQADEVENNLATGAEQFSEELGNVTTTIEQSLIEATNELQEVASTPVDVQEQSQSIRTEALQTYTEAMQQWMEQARQPIQEAQGEWQSERSEAEDEISVKVDEYVTETNDMATQAVLRFNTTAREAAESANASLASRIWSGIVEGLSRFWDGLKVFLIAFLIVFAVVLVVMAVIASGITWAIVGAAALLALAIVGIAFLIYGLITSLINRFGQAWELLGDRPWWEKLLIVILSSPYFIAVAVGDLVGLTPLLEGIFGYDAITFEELSTEERWARATQGVLTILMLLLLWRAGKAVRGRGGTRPGQTPRPSPIIDPNTGRPVGETPPPQPIIDPNTGRPVGDTPVRPTRPGEVPEPRQPVSPIEVPSSWEKFTPEHHPEFRQRLESFRGNENLEPTPGMRGGEGALWLSTRHPLLALKRWFASRVADMPRSFQLLVDVRAGVEGNPTLRSVIDVVRVRETGSDWVVRDFSPDSVPLRSALSDAAASSARGRAIAELEVMRGRGELTAVLRNLLGKLTREPPSANLHWDPASGKIIVIDMQ